MLGLLYNSPENGGLMARLITRRLVIAGALLLTLGVAACGSDAGSSSDEATEATEESHEVVPDSEVTAGLAELGTMGASASAAIAAGSDATSDVDEMFEKWESIEGTIKQNETEMYLDFEDSLANLRNAAKDKDAATAATALKSFTGTTAAYLAKHP
jgi:hypothetical protein